MGSAAEAGQNSTKTEKSCFQANGRMENTTTVSSKKTDERRAERRLRDRRQASPDQPAPAGGLFMRWIELNNVEYGECIVLGGRDRSILMVDCGSMNQKVRDGDTPLDVRFLNP